MILLKRFIPFIAALLLVGGILSGLAVASGTETTGTASVCATASTPSHTVGVDGSGVDTIAGDTATQCSTTTYTIPTVTETVTVGGTTTTAPTTTTSPAPSSSYDQAIAYTQTRPSFSASKEVDVTSASALKSALAGLTAGELVKATAPFTVTSSSGTPLTITNRLSAPAVIVLTGVTISYTGTSQVNGVWLNNASNLEIYGGSITTGQGGPCLRVYGSQHVLWWGFYLHSCGGTGFQAQAIGGPVDHDDFQGEITRTGLNNAWDPHCSLECGTGQHGANLWDANQTNAFSNNRFAFYAHDIPTGACVEYGNDSGTDPGNVLYLKCVNATFDAQKQTAGNALQTWGSVKPFLDVKYLEGDNLEGQAYRDAGLSSSTDASGLKIEYGRASKTNLNPRYAGQTTWQHANGEALVDVSGS